MFFTALSLMLAGCDSKGPGGDDTGDTGTDETSAPCAATCTLTPITTLEKTWEDLSNNAMTEIVISDDLAYVMGDGGAASTMAIIDLSDPTSLDVAWIAGRTYHARPIAVADDHLFVASQFEGLEIFDVSDPTSPVESSQYEFGNGEGGVVVHDGFAYVGGSQGLTVFNVEDVQHPDRVTELPYEDGIQTLHRDGEILYLIGYKFLAVIDISKPGVPIEVGLNEEMHYSNYDLQQTGDVLVIGTHYGGLYLVDVSDPTAPVLASTFDDLSDDQSQNGVAVDGRYAYLALDAQGVEVVDVVDPTSVCSLGGHWNAGSARDVAVSGDYLYVAGEAGLSVFDRTQCLP